MQFLSILAIALTLGCIDLQAAFAIPVHIPTNDDLLAHGDECLFPSCAGFEIVEARGKYYQNKHSNKFVQPAVPPRITLSKDVKAHGIKLDKKHKNSERKAAKAERKRGGGATWAAANRLKELQLHGRKRAEVVKYHKEVVEKHMQTLPEAHSAVIKNLAHSIGSRDPNIHISAVIQNKAGDEIRAPRLGNPHRLDTTHHVYTNKANPADGYAVLPKAYKKAVDRKAKQQGQPTGRA